MTPKISLVLGIAVTALAIVPAAFGEGRIGSLEPAVTTSVYLDANERGDVVQTNTSSLIGYRDANERGGVVQSAESSLTGYRDANERGDLSMQAGADTGNYRDAFERGTPVTGIDTGYRDAFERGAPLSEPVGVATIDSGSEIQWPQIGVAFGIGLVLLLGLALALRTRRNTPLAH